MDQNGKEILDYINMCILNKDADQAVLYIQHLMQTYGQSWMFVVNRKFNSQFDPRGFNCRDNEQININQELFQELIEAGYHQDDARYMSRNVSNYEEAANKFLRRKN